MSPVLANERGSGSKAYSLSRSHANELSRRHHARTALASSKDLFELQAAKAVPRSGTASPPGLSNNHTGRKPSVLLVAGASFLQVETGRRGPSPFENRRGKRGNVSYYSARSAARHRQLLAKVKRNELPHLPCLTYPMVFPDASERSIYKRHLKIFLQRLRYHYPTVGGTWKLEFQPRLNQEKHHAVHFHLELWGVPMDRDIIARGLGNCAARKKSVGSYMDFMQWLSRTWYEVVASGDPKHLAAGTRFERARSVAGAISYATSYSAKPEQTLEGVTTGRYWGVFGRENIPFGEAIVSDTTAAQAMRVARTARRLAQSRAKAAHLKRMALASTGRWKRRGRGWIIVKRPLFRKVHGRSARKVNRLPRIRAAGEFKCIIDADQWLRNLSRLMEQTPRAISATPKVFKPALP